VLVRTVDAADDLAAVASLAAPSRPVPLDLLHELAATGSPVAGAFDDDALVGASVGFRTPDGLHSYLTVVAPDQRCRGVGTALAWHQREWALAAGIGTITWTFDPSDVACARLTVSTLAAELTAYLQGYAVDGGDRCVATWALRSAPVTQAWHGVAAARRDADRRCRPGAELAAALDAGAHVVDVDGDGTYLLRGWRT
jgi:predicted GNAT superfamily acetyltransferase